MKVLVLFTSESIQNEQAHPDRLRSLLMEAEPDLEVDTATYDELSYSLSQTGCIIKVSGTGRDISEYDLVYLRRIKEAIAQAITVGKYCQAKGVPVIDSEIANRPGSMGKLTQYLQLAQAGLPFPDTVYAVDHKVLLEAFAASNLEFPVIVKSVSGSRGSDNHLVRSQAQLEELLQTFSGVHFLIQKYIPNTGDYRVWVCGDRPGPILFRSRKSGHLNNTSQGGDAILLEGPHELPDKVIVDCLKAAAIFQRDLAGVDVVFENGARNGAYYFFEVNRAPQIEFTPYEPVKAKALAEEIVRKVQEAKK